MVLVVRGELRLTAGKAAVQVAHAAVLLSELAGRKDPKTAESWKKGGQKKIAVVAATLDELKALEREARARALPTVWVEDAGLTEVAPGTRTVLGLGPARSDLIDQVTGKLPLL
jgi:peptidyl-tRNA hydrolase, PTH2 family